MMRHPSPLLAPVDTRLSGTKTALEKFGGRFCQLGVNLNILVNASFHKVACLIKLNIRRNAALSFASSPKLDFLFRSS